MTRHAFSRGDYILFQIVYKTSNKFSFMAAKLAHLKESAKGLFLNAALLTRVSRVGDATSVICY